MGGETGPLPDGWRVHSGGDVQERWNQGEQTAGRAWMCAWWPVRMTSDGEGESWWQSEPNFFPWRGRPCRAVATVGPCIRAHPRANMSAAAPRSTTNQNSMSSGLPYLQPATGGAAACTDLVS